MIECDTCDATFHTLRACEQHMKAKDHFGQTYECETCPREFRLERAADQHMRDTDHWARDYECETCTAKFRFESDADEHMDEEDHWAPKFGCDVCWKKFRTGKAAAQHMNQLKHYKNYCRDCDRRFISENALRMHLNSRTHRGASVSCPFCLSKFTCASGVAHHVESGSCSRSGTLNRATILRMIRDRDPDHVITNRPPSGTGSDSDSDSDIDPVYRPERDYSLKCRTCKRQFDSVEGFKSHVASPVHAKTAYHCPAQSRCGAEFKALAGVFGHLESGSCGYMSFEEVQKKFTDVISGNRMIDF